jgi:hypothetical protein
MDKFTQRLQESRTTYHPKDKQIHEINLQTLVEGYAASLVHVLDWENRVSLTTLDINEVNEFAEFLEEKFGKDYVQDLTYRDVKKLVTDFLNTKDNRDIEERDRIYYHTAKYVELETKDMEKFESWLKHALQKTGMSKTS